MTDRTNLYISLVVFSVIKGKLKVFLPGIGVPRGDLRENESPDESARRIFRENINISPETVYFEQLYTLSNPDVKRRDIAVVYYFLVPEHKIYPINDKWVSIEQLNMNKFDREIVLYAIQRLKWKIEYTNAVYSLLPDEFTFGQLQTIYEAILDKMLDKRNFRKKILSLDILKPTGHIKNLGKARPALPRGRPAETFSFARRKLTFVKIL